LQLGLDKKTPTHKDKTNAAAKSKGLAVGVSQRYSKVTKTKTTPTMRYHKNE